MRALSLWQPWATAVAGHAKRIETRSWYTEYRGPLAIHAAKRCVKSELAFYASEDAWVGALASARVKLANGPLWDLLPFGAIVATCDLIDCRATEHFCSIELDAPLKPDPVYGNHLPWTERDMGNFEPGRFGWVLGNVCPLTTPVPFVGRQGFFDVPAALLEAAR